MARDMSDIVKTAVKRMEKAVEADAENREEALDDLENIAGRQWPESIKSEREAADRPVLTVNRLPQFVRQVTGDVRRLNPAVKVLPGDGEASEEVAEIISGMIRGIEYRSNASDVYERAAESAAQCGMGFFRVRSDYESDESFDQHIVIEGIADPFSVHYDPDARMPTREDADWCFITQRVESDDFREMWPDASPVSLDDDLPAWVDGDKIVVAEYFWKEYYDRELGLLADGTVVENPAPPLNFVKKRTVRAHKVMWAKISGKDVLEGPKEFPSKHIPVIAVVGEELILGDEVVRTSVIRYAKDPQRLYNFWRSAQTEVVALQPIAPFVVTPKQIAGFEAHWAAANKTHNPYLPYNPDEKAPGLPQRASPPVASSGMMQEVLTAAEDMKATTGIYDAGLGNRSNETSGVAIARRQAESELSNSIYTDNLAKSIAYCGRVIVDMIPRVYDTRRLVKIIGSDDTEKTVAVNDEQIIGGQPVVMNDLSRGKYEVRVSVGPSFTTRRQEAAESMIDFVRAFPAAATVAGDIVAKNMDWPGSEELAERLQKLLPPGISGEQQQPDLQAMEMQAQQAAMQQKQAEIGLAEDVAKAKKAEADAERAEADAEKARLGVAEQSLELAIKSGQLDAAIRDAVARALASIQMETT